MKKDDYTTIDGVKYPILANISPQKMLEGYKMGKEKWKKSYPKGNYELLCSTVNALFEKKVVVTTQGNAFMYFDVDNIWTSFEGDFPNDLLKFLNSETK